MSVSGPRRFHRLATVRWNDIVHEDVGWDCTHCSSIMSGDGLMVVIGLFQSAFYHFISSTGLKLTSFSNTIIQKSLHLQLFLVLMHALSNKTRKWDTFRIFKCSHSLLPVKYSQFLANISSDTDAALCFWVVSLT